MQTISEEKKTPIIKALAVAGLLCLIVVLAWLAIQIVGIFPQALNSFASTAQSVYNYNPTKPVTLEISSSQTLINSGEQVTLTWNKIDLAGNYTFSFTCQEGVSLDVSSSETSFKDLACGQPYTIDAKNSLTLEAHGDKNRFSEVAYAISFFRPNSETAAAVHNGSFTIINAALQTTATSTPDNEGTATSTDQSVVVATTTPSTKPEPEPVPEVVVTPTPVKPVATPVVVAPQKPVYTYGIPVSQPNGFIDLAVTYIGIGPKENLVQTPYGFLTANQPSVIKFSVLNLGTKTSNDWSFTIDLPGEGTYRSGPQLPLKPNERALLTVAFNAAATTGIKPFTITATTDKDYSTVNNAATATVLIFK